MQKLLIKNMVCPRCIEAVRTTLIELNLDFLDIKLGEVWLKSKLQEAEQEELKAKLKALGFELLDDAKKQLIERIKNSLIKLIHHSDSELHINYSLFLSEEMDRDYRYLSSLFSAFTGMTIEKYIIQLKVEKIKEYVFYDELSISEIAYKMHYSSPAHLSRQFKQVCGLSPKEYKKQMANQRKSLDLI
ncbi:MAG: AraC family transcriptional regulator [Bacteroidales bacterium]|jgi:AraC-like DNA-binding protein|nr:AraC family transcriptional regulator [Bacteroidales bacterium]